MRFNTRLRQHLIDLEASLVMVSRTQRRMLQRLMLCREQAPRAGRLSDCSHTGCAAAAGPGQQHQLSGSTLTQACCPLSAQQSVSQHLWADCLLQQHPGDRAAGDRDAFAVLSQLVQTLAELAISCRVLPHSKQLADSSLCLLAASFPAPPDPSQYSSTPATSAWLRATPGHRQQAAATSAPGRPDGAEQEGFMGPLALCCPASWQDPVPLRSRCNPAWQRSKQFQQQRSQEPSAGPNCWAIALALCKLHLTSILSWQGLLRVDLKYLANDSW